MQNRHCAACLCLGLFALLPRPTPCAVFARQAQQVLDSAQKIVVKPIKQGPHPGDAVEFDVQLQNGKNEPVAAGKETQLELQLLGSSGEVAQTGICEIPAQSADAKCSVQAPESGIYKIKAVPKDKGLLEGTGFLLVRPQKGTPRSARDGAGKERSNPPAHAKDSKDKGAGLHLPWPYRGVSLIPAALFIQASEPAAASCKGSTGAATVVVLINDGGESGGAFRAGVEQATIQALFESDDGEGAPFPIYIWLSPDHGVLDHNPLVIPKCGISSSEGHLSSMYSGTASVAYTVLPSKYRSQGSLRATFVPVIGIVVVPQAPQILSLIDRGPIVAQFLDATGHTVATESPRTVTFVSNSSVVGVEKQSILVNAGAYAAETVILPSWIGTGSISVTADGLQTVAHEVQVVGWAVIAVCLLGGVLGGIVLYFTSGGSVVARLIVGVTTGIVVTWAYVFGLLPKLNAEIAHNYVSVFVTSIVGGYLGIKALNPILKRLGFS